MRVPRSGTWQSRYIQDKRFAIYFITNQRNTTIYTCVTSNLAKRIYEHKTKVVKGFTKKYNLDKLVYYEACDTAEEAILREKQIKAGSRKKKIELINKINPEWKDLSDLL